MFSLKYKGPVTLSMFIKRRFHDLLKTALKVKQIKRLGFLIIKVTLPVSLSFNT